MPQNSSPDAEQDPFSRSPAIIVFGGSFDPPHGGHAACLKALSKQFPTSRILVIPAAAPPPTGGVTKKPWLSFEDRLELCRLMVLDIGSPATVEVSELEGELSTPNYTVNTLEALLKVAPKSHSGSKLAITMGADQFLAFETWHRPDRIVELADLILVPRNGDALPWPAGKISQKARIWTLDVQTPLASSTLIRTAIAKNNPIPKGWVTPKVFSRLQELIPKAIDALR